MIPVYDTHRSPCVLNIVVETDTKHTNTNIETQSLKQTFESMSRFDITDSPFKTDVSEFWTLQMIKYFIASVTDYYV